MDDPQGFHKDLKISYSFPGLSDCFLQGNNGEPLGLGNCFARLVRLGRARLLWLGRAGYALVRCAGYALVRCARHAP